jgi:hypothetical protein
MTKKQKRSLAILFPTAIALMCFWYFGAENKEKGREGVSSSRTGFVPKKKSDIPLRAPASVPQAPVKFANAPLESSPVWKKNLEKTLKTQGGAFIKKIDIEKVDSFDWKVGKVDVRVDSIKVSLQNIKGQRSSFRAIVDASSGKILQTWDQPIVDNFSARIGGTIKIDSRYHND